MSSSLKSCQIFVIISINVQCKLNGNFAESIVQPMMHSRCEYSCGIMKGEFMMSGL